MPIKIRIVEAKKKQQVRECAECGEEGHDWTGGHDHEGIMARSEIKDMIVNAVKLYNMIGEGDQLPGWVSSYISLASDYIHSVTEHLSEKSIEMDTEEMPNLPIQ